MKEKPTCRICFAKFTRRGNMLRHMEDIHRAVNAGFKKNSTENWPDYNRFDSGFKMEVKRDSLTGFDRELARMSELTKIANDYIKCDNVFQTINNLKNALALREKQIEDINRNYYLVPLKEIMGLSGFLCRTCDQLGFRPVRDIGFEFTTQAHHKCDEEKVKGIKMCSIRKADLWNKENFLVSRMIEFLNFCMPGRKYIISEDVSVEFAALEKTFGLEIAKKIYGIPKRLYFHSVGQGEMRDWIKRTLRDVGKKIVAEESEIRELLMMVRSSYAMLEISAGETPRRIITSVTL